MPKHDAAFPSSACFDICWVTIGCQALFTGLGGPSCLVPSLSHD